MDFVNREPVEILGIQYHFLTFDYEGKIDAAELQKEMRLGVEMGPFRTTEYKSLKVLDAEHLFLQKRYKDIYVWKPTREIEEAIVKAIFGES